MYRICALLAIAGLLGLLPQTLWSKPLHDQLLLSLNPGISFYAMTDMNNRINQDQTGFMQIVPGEKLGPLGFGLDLGGSLQYGLCDNLLVGIDCAYLVTDTSAKVGAVPATPPQDRYYIISLPAVEIGASVKGALPLTDTLLLTVGAGVSQVILSGAGERLESRDRRTGLVYSSATLPYSGNALGFKIIAGLDWYIWEWFSLGLEGGYRLAKINTVSAKQEGSWETLRTPDGSDFTLDYTGPFIHYVFRFYL